MQGSSVPRRVLDNVVWHCLAGPHARHSSGADGARRYARGFSPLIAFADVERPAFDALAPYCERGEHFYCGGWSGRAPSGWRIDVDSAAHQMVWDGPPPDGGADLAAVALGQAHAARMLELAALTQPGPFAARTGELGRYLGVFDGGRLIAMAGERLDAGVYREISGVCTHPDYQGRGLARRLIAALIRLQRSEGRIPFLHVMRDNVHARRVYERMGFGHHQEIAVRVVARV